MLIKRPQLTLAAMLLLGPTVDGTAPSITKKEQMQYYPAGRVTVTTPNVGQNSSRRVYLTGPWMDWASSVTGPTGLTAKIMAKRQGLGSGELEIIIYATAGVARGNHSMSVNIGCPPVSLDCNAGPVKFDVRVLETGPVTSIAPAAPASAILEPGKLAPNTEVLFIVNAQGADIARILPRLTTLKNVSIVAQVPGMAMIQVRGTTPACGGVDIGLIDRSATAEDPVFVKATGYTGWIAGTICPGSIPNPPPTSGCTTVLSCPSGYVWSPTSCMCIKQ